MPFPTPSVEINFEDYEELTASELSEPCLPPLPKFPPLPTTNQDAQADGESQADLVTVGSPEGSTGTGYQASVQTTESVAESPAAEAADAACEKKYRALATCSVSRDFAAKEPTGRLSAGTVVTAVQRKGTRIKIKLPSPDDFGWIDLECASGERLVKPVPAMQTLSDDDCPGPAKPPITYPPAPQWTVAPNYLPVAPPFPGRPLVPSLPFKNRIGLPTLESALTLEPLIPSTEEGTPAPKEPKPAPEAPKGEIDAIPMPEEFPALRPSMRRRSFPVPVSSPMPAPAPMPMPTAVKRRARRSRPKKNDDTGKRRGQMMSDYFDPHQALVSNTPGVVLYPRDPETGAVIVPKHLRRRSRTRLRRKRSQGSMM